jgi:hypothetical protein
MNASIESVSATREIWSKIVSTVSMAEMEPTMRRSTRRYSCSGEIKVSGEIDGEPFKQTWVLLQVSATGISARAHIEVPDRLKVAIVWRWQNQELLLSGRVMHSTQTVGGYKVGIRLNFP